MASISMVIAPKCKQHAFNGEGDCDWFGYTNISCIEEDYYNGEGDDDDDDGGYDYAPAA
ncbi:hypothetical protein MTR_2g084140 [Medicago truncatula]|uniref:Uncharacterized protein n=1 Tax=Medicago truncatula TaxID=3880 RepID=G7IM89_MEDTR|nr:hypothetical protein MTR_2g084140 [Medicago truncatula]